MKKIYIQLMLFLLCIPAIAQEQLTNTGNFQINPGTALTFFGNLNNSGTVTDSGQSVSFSGTAAQIISGTSVTTLRNPDINNSSGVTLQQSIIASNTLSLSSGPLNLNSKTLTVNNSSSAALSRTNGFIASEQVDNSGKVIWNIGNSTGAHVYPFGTTSGTYIPFTLNLTAGNIGNVSVSTYPTAFDNTPYPSTPTSVSNLNDGAGNDNSVYVVDRFWQIDKDGASGTATLTFTATNAEVGSITPLRAQRWNSSISGWDAQLPSQTNTTFSATVPGVTAFSPWILSSSGSPLPISLLNFSAALSNHNVDISWATSSEINNDYFTIEKTSDFINYATIGIVDGAGNSSHTINYSSIDDNPYSGDSYYRLRQTDYNGKFTYSQFASIKEEEGFSFCVFPNPILSGQIPRVNLSGFSEGMEVQVVLYDILGNELSSKVYIVGSSGNDIIAIDLSENLLPGIYVITAASDKSLMKQRLIVN